MDIRYGKSRRWYTSASFRLMKRVRLLLVILLSPLWLPLYALATIGDWSGRVVDQLDSGLQRILDHIIPQKK
ncbi:hypothetical protein ACFYKX_10445 [Cytobacillus sp. FJAT-54145]|uniref:Uncharacterized protein n=1 Tax=Cytobacillus spartinae TaxID=3299023 RepID=A0ABW6KA50_9BACI